jgi:hypothetical protein
MSEPPDEEAMSTHDVFLMLSGAATTTFLMLVLKLNVTDWELWVGIVTLGVAHTASAAGRESR